MRGKTWDIDQIKDYMNVTIDGMTEDEILQSANYLLNRYEEKKRATEFQGDNQTEDDHYFGVKE